MAQLAIYLVIFTSQKAKPIKPNLLNTFQVAKN